MSIRISFTENEIDRLVSVIEEWEDFLNADNEDYYAWKLNNGLGTAWHKLVDARDKIDMRHSGG